MMINLKGKVERLGIYLFTAMVNYTSNFDSCVYLVFLRFYRWRQQKKELKMESNNWFCSWNILSVVFVMFSAMMCLEMSLYFDCLGAPFLYVTFHGVIKNVAKYSRDGCMLKSNILKGKANVQGGREVALGYYKHQEALYVIDSEDDTYSETQILIYGTCDRSGHRYFKTELLGLSKNPGAFNGFSIDFDKNGNLYASFQGSDAVLRFTKDIFLPMDLPKSLIADTSNSTTYYPGTFFQYNSHFDPYYDGIRGIQFVGDNLWVCNANEREIAVVDPKGSVIAYLEIPGAPIALHYDHQSSGLVFVSCKGLFGGGVYSVNPTTMIIETNYTHVDMRHCSGVTSYEDTLFVSNQDIDSNGAIYTFDISTGNFIGIIQSVFPDKVEHISLSNC